MKRHKVEIWELDSYTGLEMKLNQFIRENEPDIEVISISYSAFYNSKEETEKYSALIHFKSKA